MSWNSQSNVVDPLNVTGEKFNMPKSRLVISLFVFLSFIAAFIVYSRTVSYDVFYEADFLHIPFLEGLANGKLSEGSFIAIFGEHFFPGYNLILAVNFFLFGISGHFTAFLSSVSIILTAVVLNVALYKYWRFGGFSFFVVCVAANAVLLSPVNNLFSGMALAAQIGSLVSAIILVRVSEKISFNANSIIPFVAVPISIIFLLGGYSVGLIASLIVGAVLVAFSRGDFKYSLGMVLCLIVSLAIYMFFIVRYGSLFGNAPRGEASSLIRIFQFYLVMTASSVIGSSLMEFGGNHNFYFIVGGVLTAVSVVAVVDILVSAIRGRASLLSNFVLMLLAYSIVTIVFVSIFRVKSGISAGVGQWYMAHIKFLPFGLAVWAGEKMGAAGVRTWPLSVAAGAALTAILAFTAVGYRGDWIKGYYVRGWKAEVASHALEMLEAPAQQLPSIGMQSLLWEPQSAKRGIDFFYKKNLWIFRTRDIKVQGLGPDGSLAPGKTAYIACPVGTTALAFKVSGDRSAGPLEIRSGPQSQAAELGGSVRFDFQTTNAVVKLSLPASGPNGASPASATPAVPVLMTDIVCQLAGPRRDFPER